MDDKLNFDRVQDHTIARERGGYLNLNLNSSLKLNQLIIQDLSTEIIIFLFTKKSQKPPGKGLSMPLTREYKYFDQFRSGLNSDMC